MKPSLLRPGDLVQRTGSSVVLTFVRREPARGPRAAVNVFRAKAYAGLDGPGDDGTCVAPDYQVIHAFRLVAHAARGGFVEPISDFVPRETAASDAARERPMSQPLRRRHEKSGIAR